MTLITYTVKRRPGGWAVEYGDEWTAILDTDSRVEQGQTFAAGASFVLEHHSLVMLTRPPVENVRTLAGTPAASPSPGA